MMAPEAIINQISAVELYNSPVITTNEGLITHTSDVQGLTMFSTLVVAPRSFTFKIEATGKAHNIGLFADETLLRTGANRVKYEITVPEGITPLNVVFVGPAERLQIKLPLDVMTIISSYIPAVPNWRSPFPIETNYVDPKSGSTGNALFWEGQSKIGGWGIYKLTSTGYGNIVSASVRDGRYLIRTNSTNIPNIPSVVEANDEVIGTVREANLNDDATQLVLFVDAAMEYVDTDTLSGTTLNVLYFNHLHDLLYFSSDSGISYVDTNVQAGTEYSYVLDSFAAFDRSLRSNKTEIQTVTAGDVYPPGSITILDSSVINSQILVRYQTPADEDYLGTHVYFSGTANSLLVDYGNPGVEDSLAFWPTDSGTYYFVTFDMVGNEQYVYSGESLMWDGLSIVTGPNQPPTLAVRQLTAAETQADNFSPTYVARYELDASDPDTDKLSLVVYYRREEDPDWLSVSGAGLPYKVNVLKATSDNWLRVKAFDGLLYSDELTFICDFDVNPEISSVYGHLLTNSGAVFVNGAVDDDTQSLKWFITDDYTGPIGSDPSSGSPALINNLLSWKTFSFSFALTDGQRKVLQIDPYSADSGTGDLGLSYSADFIRPPRTHVYTLERAFGGAVIRTSASITLKPSPETAVVKYKVDPVDWGDVTGATASTLSDSIKNWTTDYFNDTHEVRITAGTGEGQVRSITDTTDTQLTVSPNWTTTPDTSSDYHIRHIYREIWDAGTVTSATNNTLTDSTKNWMDNTFIQSDVEVYAGTGTGQKREVTDSTGDTLTTDLNWTTNPVSGDKYRVHGIVTITKNAEKDKTLYFYADVPGIATEEERSLVLDTDALPEISALDLTEPSDNLIRAKVSGIDDDAKEWRLYAAKDGWPTVGEAEGSTLDEDFKRFDGPVTINTIEFNVEAGTWYGIAVPVDSFSNTGPRVTDTIVITGAVPPGGGPASLSNLRVISETDDPDDYNRILWDHTDSAEDPGDDGDHTVKIYAYRSDRGPASEVEITTPSTRYTWQDSEDGDYWANENSTAESANTYSNRGSMLHLVYLNGPDSGWMTWHYRIELYSGATYLDEYNVAREDDYSHIRNPAFRR
jgi:hypothetical protein